MKVEPQQNTYIHQMNTQPKMQQQTNNPQPPDYVMATQQVPPAHLQSQMMSSSNPNMNMNMKMQGQQPPMPSQQQFIGNQMGQMQNMPQMPPQQQHQLMGAPPQQFIGNQMGQMGGMQGQMQGMPQMVLI
jgi:hypothetical protein